MIKIFIPQRAQEGIGGGWTFTRNIIKALDGKVEFTNNLSSTDIYFMTSSSTTERDEAQFAKQIGKRMVLRVDNVPRNSRNRNTGTSKLYDFAQMADVIIYQSKWAKRFVSPFIRRDGIVIINGTDETVFRKEGAVIPKDGNPQYLFVRHNRDETKRWEKAWYDFQTAFFDNNLAHLWIVGQFDPSNITFNFDFFGGAEYRYKYFGVIEDRNEMAKMYRSADVLLLPYFIDACSNTAIEAKLCGCKIEYDRYQGGGTSEIMNTSNSELTLKVMGSKYLEIFKSLV